MTFCGNGSLVYLQPFLLPVVNLRRMVSVHRGNTVSGAVFSAGNLGR